MKSISAESIMASLLDNPDVIQPFAKVIVKQLIEQDIKEKAYALFQAGYIVGKSPARLAGKFQNPPTVHDMVRLATLYLLAREIELKDISGSIAELGVYQGVFSVHIRKAFPDRIYYLFDTFSGFDQKQAEVDIKKFGANIPLEAFTNTSVDRVLKRISVGVNRSKASAADLTTSPSSRWV